MSPYKVPLVAYRATAQKMAAACFAAIFLYAASQYPFKATYIFTVLLIYISLMIWDYQLWLFVLPALIPTLDLAPWTGWFFIEEIDLLLLVTASFGYWNLDQSKPHARLSWFAAVCVSMLSLVYLIGLYRGFACFEISCFETVGDVGMNDYLSHYNSLRIGKSWFWMLIFLPLLTRAVGANLANIKIRFVAGILSGLAFVSTALIMERLTFPGFFNFSTDYRTSAPFSAMHTGGAALDGFLALSFPLIAVPLLTRQHHLNTIISLVLLALSAYGGLTTFSRGLYFAYMSSIIVAGALIIAFHLAKRKFNWISTSVATLLFTLIIYALTQMFVAAGYRGFMAAMIFLFSGWIAKTTFIVNRKLSSNILIGIAIQSILFNLLPSSYEAIHGAFKPPYIHFLLSALAFVYLAWCRRNAVLLTKGWINPPLIALTCMSINMLWIGYHWAGVKALAPSIGIIVITLLLIKINTIANHSFLQSNRNSMPYILSFIIIASAAIPISSSYFAHERFSRSKEDLQYRIQHWSQALDMMDHDYPTKIFGMGLGRFPWIYSLRNTLREPPASLHYMKEIGSDYLRLSGPIYSNGTGEPLRLLQRVSTQENKDYTLAVDIRNVTGRAPFNLGVALCERQLLYRQNCIAAKLPTIAHDSLWHHYEATFNAQKLGVTPWPWRAPIQIEFSIDGINASLDLDNISLRDNLDNELIRNGAFTKINDYWFFSSDRYHLPWHIKNFTFNLYFELGWLGVIALYSLLLHSVARQFLLARAGQIMAVALLSSLLGFLVVGFADSLLDVPRLGLLFFLILICCVLQPMTARTRRPANLKFIYDHT